MNATLTAAGRRITILVACLIMLPVALYFGHEASAHFSAGHSVSTIHLADGPDGIPWVY